MSQSPSPSVFVALGVAAGLLGSADPGPAQEKPASPPSVVQESAGVTLIEIPVNVIGKDGKPVAGLSVDDFELFDDGKKQPINGLEVIDLSKPAPAGPSGQPEAIPASARRLWLFVFDLSYTSPSGLVRARDGAREFVTKAMQPNDLAAVGTLSTETGWKLLVNFTRDRRQLGWAIDTLGLAPEQRASDPLSFAYVPPGPSGPSGSPATGPRDGDILENMRDIQRLQKVSTDEQARGRVTKLMTNLSGIGRVLDSTRGRKHVLFFSEGFETRLLSGHMASGDRSSSLSAQPISSAAQDTATVQGTGDAALSGELWKVDSDARFGNTATRSVLLEALALFARSDAVLDTIDISGLRAESDATGAKAGSGTDALFAMAAATDGDLIRNANQLGGELAKLEERTALVYLLIYQPAQLSKPGAFHQLRVRTKASGARVLARSGYYEPRPYQNLSPLEKLLTAGDLVTGGSRENEIPGNLLAASFASQSDVPQVPVLVEIPGRGLLAGQTGEKIVLQIYVYANDTSGTLADYVASEMTLDLGKVRAALEAGGIKFYGTLYLSPGQYGVRALVRDGSTGRSGVYAASCDVPKIPGGTPTVLPPFFEEEPGRWLMVRGNPRADAPARPADYPFAISGESFIPSAMPSLAAGSGAEVALVAYNFPLSDKPTPLDVRAEIVGPDGQSRPAPVTVSRRSDFERGGGRKVVLAFKPEGLSPGRYALKVALTDPGSKKTAESASTFEVR